MPLGPLLPVMRVLSVVPFPPNILDTHPVSLSPNDNPGPLLPQHAPLLRLGTVAPPLLPAQEAKHAAAPALLARQIVVRPARVGGQRGVLAGQVGPAAASVQRDLHASRRALDHHTRRAGAADASGGGEVSVRLRVGGQGRWAAGRVAARVAGGRALLVLGGLGAVGGLGAGAVFELGEGQLGHRGGLVEGAAGVEACVGGGSELVCGQGVLGRVD